MEAFTTAELADLMVKKFYRVLDDIWRRDDTAGDSASDEEIYNNEQIMASEAEPLKKYIMEPGVENLLRLKSYIAGDIDVKYSHTGIAYLKKVVSRSKTEFWKYIELQEKVLATPDDTWIEAIKQNMEHFEIAKEAPDEDDDDFGGEPFEEWWNGFKERIENEMKNIEKYGLEAILTGEVESALRKPKAKKEPVERRDRYYYTCRITGNTTALLELFKKAYDWAIRYSIEEMVAHNWYVIRNLVWPFSTGGVGMLVKKREHLEKNGLDGFADYHANFVLTFVKTEDGFLLRVYDSDQKNRYKQLIDYPWENLMYPHMPDPKHRLPDGVNIGGPEYEPQLKGTFFGDSQMGLPGFEPGTSAL